MELRSFGEASRRMYKIIGIDGRQYGPVSQEEIRSWIAVGRADAETRAQVEGSTDWRTLSDFPEFAEALAAKTPSSKTGASTPEAPSGGTRSAADVGEQPLERIGRRVTVDAGSCLGRAWDRLMFDLWPNIGISALLWLALGVADAFYVGVILTGPMLGGICFYYLKQIRGQQARIEDAFAGFTLSFVQLMVAGLVTHLLTAVGLALCILPGIYLAVAWCFALPLVIDKQLGFWEAMETSRQAVYKQWWSVFLLMFLCTLINVGGGLLCCVGFFFTLPLTGLAMMYAYEDVFGNQAAKIS